MLMWKVAPRLLVLVGSMDWLTTIIGISWFGALESNPFLAEITQSSLPVFTLIKLGAVFLVAFLFYQAERSLNSTQDRTSRSFASVRWLLTGAYSASVILLLAAVVNNLLTVVALSK
jgi:hypothetical protein